MLDSNPRLSVASLNINPPPLVVPGHRAPACSLALSVACRHLGALPPAGGHQPRQLDPALDQALGHADAVAVSGESLTEARGF